MDEKCKDCFGYELCKDMTEEEKEETNTKNARLIIRTASRDGPMCVLNVGQKLLYHLISIGLRVKLKIGITML